MHPRNKNPTKSALYSIYAQRSKNGRQAAPDTVRSRVPDLNKVDTKTKEK